MCGWSVHKSPPPTWRLNASCAMLVAVAGCSVLVMTCVHLDGNWEVLAPLSPPPSQKKGCTVQCFLFHTTKTCQYSHVPVGSTEVEPDSPGLSAAHAEYGTRNQNTDDKLFSSVVVFFLRQKRICLLRKERSGILEHRLDAHCCLGNFSVFNRILFWFVLYCRTFTTKNLFSFLPSSCISISIYCWLYRMKMFFFFYCDKRHIRWPDGSLTTLNMMDWVLPFAGMKL